MTPMPPGSRFRITALVLVACLITEQAAASISSVRTTTVSEMSSRLPKPSFDSQALTLMLAASIFWGLTLHPPQKQFVAVVQMRPGISRTLGSKREDWGEKDPPLYEPVLPERRVPVGRTAGAFHAVTQTARFDKLFGESRSVPRFLAASLVLGIVGAVLHHGLDGLWMLFYELAGVAYGENPALISGEIPVAKWILMPIAEEALFRGGMSILLILSMILIPRLAKSPSSLARRVFAPLFGWIARPWLLNCLQAAGFAAYHFVGTSLAPGNAPMYFTGGLFYGYLTIMTNHFFAGAIAHLLHNTLVVILRYYPAFYFAFTGGAVTLAALIAQRLFYRPASNPRHQRIETIRKMYGSPLYSANLWINRFYDVLFFAPLRRLTGRTDLYSEIGRLIGRSLPPNSRVLSVGVGSGRKELAIKRFNGESNARIYGMDVTEAQLERAKGHGVTPVFGDGEHAPFKDRSFDAIIISESLGHMDRMRALQEAARVLKPGGQIFILSYAKNAVLSRLSLYVSYKYRADSPGEIIEDLGSVGFGDAAQVRLTAYDKPFGYFMVRGTKSTTGVSGPRWSFLSSDFNSPNPRLRLRHLLLQAA